MSAARRRILFARAPGEIRDALWSPAAQKMGRELGYDVEFYPEAQVADHAEWPRRLNGMGPGGERVAATAPEYQSDR